MSWLRTLLSGRPHQVIGGSVQPYMLRWYLIPRNRRVNVYLHKFLRSDDDRALHDHPWWFLSIMLCGRYHEVTDWKTISRRAPSIAFRQAEHRHRVELLIDDQGREIPCWTLVITGSKTREWFFYCPKGPVHWREFVDARDPGAVGRGCGDG